MARLPNILITGTPGTGKTTTAEAVGAAAAARCACFCGYLLLPVCCLQGAA